MKAEKFYSSRRSKILVNKIFSLEKDPDTALKDLSVIHASLHEFMGETIEIDFSDCEAIDLHTIFVLRIIVNDYRSRQFKLQQKVFTKNVITSIRIRPSANDEVNKRLFAGGILSSITIAVDQMMPISTMGFFTGDRTQKHFTENKKGITATRIVRYFNKDCLQKYEFELTRHDQNRMEALISEILNNAEDHGLHTKWYATGYLFEDNRVLNDPKKDIVGELSITLFNFGQSFFEGLEATKLENKTTYDELERLYQTVVNARGGNKFSKENYFTLFALQDGVSRLKYEEESRGTGTMKFINSFLNIGDYEDLAKGYSPQMTIITGSTMLKCDNRYKSFEADGDYYLSLNSEKDLSIPPAESHLKPLNIKFPGTVLAIKIYLNKDHLSKKISRNGK